MMDINERVVALETARDSIYHEISEIKKEVSNIHALTTSVEKLATQMEMTTKTLDKIDQRLENIEKEPGDEMKHYKRIVAGCLITGILGAVLGAVLALIFK